MPAWKLTPAVLEEEHSAAEYLAWVQSIIDRVKAGPDGLQQIRFRVGLAKELMNEALPIGRLAAAHFGSSRHVALRLKIGNQGYDAEVSDRRSPTSEVQFIEVTLASEGEGDYLRMKVLHETGEVSGLGSVSKSGTKRTGLTVNVEREAVSQAEVLRRERQCIADAIERKAGKTYPPNTLLLIAFDDTMAFDRPDNIDNIESTISSSLPRLVSFHSVAIVGMQCDLFLHRRI